MLPSRAAIFTEVDLQADSRSVELGGEKYDDSLGVAEWVAGIVRVSAPALSGSTAVFRHQMITLAALAVAAVESIDRRTNNNLKPPPEAPSVQADDKPAGYKAEAWRSGV